MNWTSPGSKIVTVNYTNANGCMALNATTMGVTVTDIPGPAGSISGVGVVCEGGTNYVYSVPAIPNAHAYVWTLPAGASIASGEFTNSISVNYALGSSSGNVTVSGNSTCGNGATSPAFPVSVNVVPVEPGVIMGPNSLCQGTAGVIYSVPEITGATGYVWVVPTGGTIVGGANTNTITVDFSMAAISGDITVYGTNACGNGSTGQVLALTVMAAPPTPVITLTALQLSSDAATGNQWYKDGTPITGATGQTYDVSAVGTYWDVVTLSGCASMPSNTIDISEVGINNNQGPAISVYPVPNNGMFNLSITSSLSGSYTLRVLNDLGVEVYIQKDLVVTGTFSKVIDLRPIPAGVYSLIISNADTRVVRKIVVNK